MIKTLLKHRYNKRGNKNKKKIIKNTDIVNVDLKSNAGTIATTIDGKEAKLVLRTWADKDRFSEFRNEYNDSQENSSLSNSSEVQSRVKATLSHYDENEKIKRKKQNSIDCNGNSIRRE